MEVSPSVREDKELALTKVGRGFMPPSPSHPSSVPSSPSLLSSMFLRVLEGRGRKGGREGGGREREGDWICRKWVDERRSREPSEGILDNEHKTRADVSGIA